MRLYEESRAQCANEYVTVMALSVARTKTTRFDCCCAMGERRCGCAYYGSLHIIIHSGQVNANFTNQPLGYT